VEVGRLTKYLELLIKWQRGQRLVGSSEPDWVIDHIILDSLLFTRLLPSTAQRILDLGSGAGVPGIPLKIVLEPVSFTLLEARAKRVSFLSTVVRELALPQCEIVSGRLEWIADDSASAFDAVVMRCAGDPTQLADAALTVLKPAGTIVATGPPRRRATPIGKWSQVDGPLGRRLFWVLRKS